MAKKTAPSKNSRAARRATSPGINTDQSLKDLKPPSAKSSTAPERPSVLAARHGSGVQKSKAKRKAQMSSKARRRHERSMQMAEAVVERTSSKVRRSEGRGRAVTSRRKGWDEINQAAQQEVGRDDGGRAEEEEEEEEEGGAGGGWETDDEEMGGDGGQGAPAQPATQKGGEQQPGETEGYIAIDEDEEIL